MSWTDTCRVSTGLFSVLALQLNICLGKSVGGFCFVFTNWQAPLRLYISFCPEPLKGIGSHILPVPRDG